MSHKEYQNPIIYCDYSDPDVIRVGDYFYMTASSFNNVPGLPVLMSHDLVNWELRGYALERLPCESYDLPRYGCGVWAPSIRYHDGWFYIFFPMPDEGIFYVRTRDPEGKWCDPVKICDGPGLIDPCPLWDSDGKAYLVYAVAKSRVGYNSKLFIAPMDPDDMRLGPPRMVYDGIPDGNITIEGPKLYKRNGIYYIFAPAGGVKTGWQVVLKSGNIYGPYEPRIVMRQGRTGINGPHQGAWVEDVSGQSWFIHFQDVFAAGRIVHLQPMTWNSDWPVIGSAPADMMTHSSMPYTGDPVLTYEAPEVFVAALPEPERDSICRSPWQWNANPDPGWIADYSSSNPGEEFILPAVRTGSEKAIADYPNLLLRKWEAPEFVVTGSLDLTGMKEGSTFGILSFGTIYSALTVRVKDGTVLIKGIKGEMSFSGSEYKTEEEEPDLPCAAAPLRGSINFLIEVIRTNNVTATSLKPQALPGGESNVYHPTEKVRISVFDPAYGSDPLAVAEVGSSAGRWTGAKFGFFHTADEMKEMKAFTFDDGNFVRVYGINLCQIPKNT